MPRHSLDVALLVAKLIALHDEAVLQHGMLLGAARVVQGHVDDGSIAAKEVARLARDVK